MSGVPIVDLSPIGDQDSVSRHSGALASIAADVAGTSKTAKASFEKALNSWEGGPRRALFQHAATGIQAELLTLITAANSAADLTDSYFGALKSSNDQLNEMQTSWTSEQLKLYPAPAPPDVSAEVVRTGNNLIGRAAQIRQRQQRFGALIAADFDKLTDLLVPGGARLSPEAIARKVHDALGGGSTGQPVTAAQVASLLGIAAHAAPPAASKPDGDLDLAELAREANDRVVAGTTLGGEGWAIVNLVDYHSGAAALAYETNVRYAGLTGVSVQELEARRLGANGSPSSILKFAAEEDVVAHSSDPQAARLAHDVIKGGPFEAKVGGALGVLGIIGDYTTLQHLDEIRNPTERTAVKYASWANALGISRSLYTSLALANSGDEVPGWGEAVATLTGVFLAGDYVFHEAPNLVRETKDGITKSLQNWALSRFLAPFGV